jgi:hypothetical protein
MCTLKWPATYRIVVAGQIDASWSDWFDGLTVAPQPSGTTVMTGPVRDQAALYGLLERFRDIGLTLLTVERIEINEE